MSLLNLEEVSILVMLPLEERQVLTIALLHHCFQDPTESQNLANQHPELVKELLAEAELVLKDAPMQVGCV